MKQKAALKSTDQLFFPQDVTFRPCDEGWLVVAIPTANWIVLPDNFQKQFLEQLMQGKSITKVTACSISISPMLATYAVPTASCAQVNLLLMSCPRKNGYASSQSSKQKAVKVLLSLVVSRS